jgi:hypothetical protein
LKKIVFFFHRNNTKESLDKVLEIYELPFRMLGKNAMRIEKVVREGSEIMAGFLKKTQIEEKSPKIGLQIKLRISRHFLEKTP